jgi:hypothetical protein
MLHLLLVIHNHQPLGNLPQVFRKAYNVAYSPFLDVIEKHPGIKWALHSSGCLWEWIEREEPGYPDRIRKQLADGRLEILTGGMWEPIQPLIHEASFYHQFAMMNRFLKDTFDVVPIGSWTTERVWEPGMASRLNRAGVRYTLLDDSQLRAGLPSPDRHPVWGYYRTENNGRSVAIFPINEMLRYMIPFQPAEKAVGYLEKLAQTLPGNAGITYGDDGEKFGMWPETYDWVYKKGWLDEFLGRIEQSSLITTTHPSEYKKIVPHPRQRVYIPTSSYREMGVWNLYPNRNLAAEKIYEWVQANDEINRMEPPHVSGLFRTFLARYPESRDMHERIQEIIDVITEREPDIEPSGDSDSPLERALWHALRGQCNCTYWHGVFGGLYLNYLRYAVHKEILLAEKEMAKAEPKFPNVRSIGTTRWSVEDSRDEPDPESNVLVVSGNTCWVIDPTTGQVISAGSIEKGIDVADVLARRFEAYHATMQESEGSAGADHPASIHDIHAIPPQGWREGFGYDKCRRGCFAERLLNEHPGLDRLARVEYESEFGPETTYWTMRVDNDAISLDSVLPSWHRKKIFKIGKENREAVMKYSLSRIDGRPYNGLMFLEFNIGLLAGDSHDRYHLLQDGTRYLLSDKFERDGIEQANIIDEWSDVEVRIDVPGSIWMGVYPVKTLSRGEGGLEMNYQATSVLFALPVEIKAGGEWRMNGKMSVESL